MKKIAWVTPEYFLDTDIYIIERLRSMYSIDWYVITVTDTITEYAEKIADIEKSGTNVTIYKIHRKGMSPGNAILFNNLLSRIKKNKAQMLYTSLSYPAYYLPIVKARMGKKKVVLAIHNVHVPKGGSHYLRNKYYNRFAVHAFENYQTFSRSQYKKLKEIAPNARILYAPFILKDFGQSKKKKENDSIVFMSFGNIRDYKRIDVLIEAAQAAFEETRLAFKVIIAGQCDNWERYQALIRYPELFDIRIRRIDNDEIPDLFAESDYFVTPYQDIAQSGSAMIAVNYNKPIISSKLPAFEEYIQEGITGYFIKPADKEDLKNTMKYVLEHHQKEYSAMVNNIEKFKRDEFSASKITGKYKEFIDAVIKK